MLSPVSGQGGVELLMYLPMEASAVSPSAQLSFFSYRPDRTRAYPSRPWKQRISQPTRIHCQKMYVAGG